MGSLVGLECDPDPDDNHCRRTADTLSAASNRVPPGCPTSAGLTTSLARKLFKAMQDWGAYVADNSFPPAIDVESGVPEEVATAYSIDLWAEHTDTGATHDYFCDWWRIWVNLELVTNNDALHVGGSSAPSGTSAAEGRFHLGIKRPPPIGN